MLKVPNSVSVSLLRDVSSAGKTRQVKHLKGMWRVVTHHSFNQILRPAVPVLLEASAAIDLLSVTCYPHEAVWMQIFPHEHLCLYIVYHCIVFIFLLYIEL